MSRNAERMQYQSDRLSYTLCVFGIIFNMIYFVSIYTNKSIVPDVVIGADVIINIVFMMIVFLASEKLKSYEKKWNIYVILAGAVQILRIFWLPMHYNRLEMLVDTKFILIIIWLLASSAVLILAGINATINGILLSKLDDDSRVGG